MIFSRVFVYRLSPVGSQVVATGSGSHNGWRESEKISGVEWRRRRIRLVLRHNAKPRRNGWRESEKSSGVKRKRMLENEQSQSPNDSAKRLDTEGERKRKTYRVGKPKKERPG